MIDDLLRKIGLSDGEIKIYNILLNGGMSPVNKIHEKAGMERRNIYDILNKLIGKGLVSYGIENKRRVFQLTHPNKMIGYIEEKKYDLDKVQDEIKKIVPSIIQKFNSKKLEINAETYRGIEGVKSIWEDMLDYKIIYWIGSGRYVPKMAPYWFINWNKRRVRLKVKFLNICRYEMQKEIKHPLKYEYLKFLPKEFSGNPTVIGIYGNKTVNFIFDNNIFAFLIDSKGLADNYRAYHKYLWDNIAKEYK